MPLQRSPAGARPIGRNSRNSAKVGEDPAFIAREHHKLAPPKSGNGTNAKASDVRFVAALKSISVRSSDIRGIDAIEPMAVNHVVPVMAKTAQWLP